MPISDGDGTKDPCEEHGGAGPAPLRPDVLCVPDSHGQDLRRQSLPGKFIVYHFTVLTTHLPYVKYRLNKHPFLQVNLKSWIEKQNLTIEVCQNLTRWGTNAP